MGKPIFITGAGIISAIGLNKQEVLSSLLAEKSGIAGVQYLDTEHQEFPVGEVKLTNEQMMQMLDIKPDSVTTRTSLMGILAMKEALGDANLTREDIHRAAFVSGTTVSGMDKIEQYYLDFINNDKKNNYIVVHDCGTCSEMICDYFGDFAFVTSVSTACSSAANAIIRGAAMIRAGLFDIAVVGGSECLTKFHLNGFNSLKILDTELCRPFDETRSGLNLGEGAAYLVLESYDSMRRRNVKPLSVLAGYGNVCDAYHQTASSPEGKGPYLAMKEALEDAGLNVSDIDYINAHGTATPNNDLTESIALKRLFSDRIPPVSSTKAFTGHTTSATGSIEAVICILAIRNQFLPVNLNWKNQMENGITPVTDMHPDRPVTNVLCNSFGFGGNDSSLLLCSSEIYDKE
ncbi:MAG: beta-ketoacyl-[Bacteroidales bacterium]|nr:beta-ketoacyl-[acyl-carrier-protein] synthase family protein [Bacteroidales bacterium]